MKFHTEIKLSPPCRLLDLEESSLFLGSCFAENMGQRLAGLQSSCTVNPFGILFNPLSVLQTLERLQAKQPFQSSDLTETPELWVSLAHHGRFSTPSQQETLMQINASYEPAARHFHATRTLILTFGTAYAYRHKTTGRVVANCHKLPAEQFTCKRLTENEIVTAYTPFLQSWLQENPQRQVLFTVSPVRHLRDGLHENNLSKATLLLAIDTLTEQFPTQTAYFPAYELLLDELRDYRFYADDLLHPSVQAEEYIFECFLKTCFTPEAQAALQEIATYRRMAQHRPLHPSTESAKSFRHKVLQERERLQIKYPFLFQ